MAILRGITWDHPRGYDSVVAASAAWMARHPGDRVVWDKRSLQAFADMPLEALVDAYDLLVIDHPHIPAVAASGLLVPLDGAGYEVELATLARESIGPSHESYAHGGHQWALAIDAAAQVAVYRPDLLPEPPKTWDDVWPLAEKGLVLWPAKPIDALSSFLTLAANLGSPCGTAPERFIDRAAGRQVLADLHRLAEAVPSFCLQANPIEVAERLAASDAWMYAPLAFGYVNYTRAGFRPHRLAYRDMPEGPRGVAGSCLGGAGVAVSARSPHRDDAVAFAFWLASAEAQRGPYFEGGGQPAHLAVWRDSRLNHATLNFFSGTLATLQQAWVRPRLPGWLTVQDAASHLVHQALTGVIDDITCLEKLDGIHRRAWEDTAVSNDA